MFTNVNISDKLSKGGQANAYPGRLSVHAWNMHGKRRRWRGNVVKPKLYAIALLTTLLILIHIEIRHQTQLQQIADLTNENAMLQSLVEAQKRKIDELTKALEAQQTKATVVRTTSRGGDRLTSLGKYTITAYCACTKCCGKYAANRPGGKVIGSAGTELTPGLSVAAWLPFGTRLLIDGQEYVVEDRTADWIRDKYDSKIIDVYFADHAQALEWGKRTAEVWVVK